MSKMSKTDKRSITQFNSFVSSQTKDWGELGDVVRGGVIAMAAAYDGSLERTITAMLGIYCGGAVLRAQGVARATPEMVINAVPLGDDPVVVKALADLADLRAHTR
ncbi:MAG: hypothetical protein ACO32I_06275 [Candidatus Limnocylindrus sp.]